MHILAFINFLERNNTQYKGDGKKDGPVKTRSQKRVGDAGDATH